jgi:membrane protease YdiL (CAAX protease family)
MSAAQWRWSLLAGVLAVMCLWLLYAAFGNPGIAGTAGIAPGREAALPAGMLFMFLLVSAAVTALGEEGGLRGFAQARLERRFGPRVAIGASTLAFVLIHATHGLPILVRMAPFYVAVGVVYGLLAYLTQSILPSLALHLLGDILTFGLRSSLIRLSVPHNGAATLLCLGGALVLGSLSILAFSRLGLARCRGRRTARDVGAR